MTETKLAPTNSPICPPMFAKMKHKMLLALY